MSIVRGHAAELRQLSEFLHRTDLWPGGAVISGEPGIGKSTLWTSAVAEAMHLGVRVMSARTSPQEVTFGYSALADLLHGIGPDVTRHLPCIQQEALDRVLLRNDRNASAERVTAAAFQSALVRLSAQTPVLIAIDDAQWLDPASRTALSYATRRLNGPVSVLTTVRSRDPQDPQLTTSLPLPQGVSPIRIPLGPMTGPALHAMISARLGIRLSRPVIDRIHQISGGNAFCALELARAFTDEWHDGQPRLPASLTGVINRRLGPTEGPRGEILLALACTAESTVAELASMTGSSLQQAVQIVDEAEERGVVTVDGNKVRFTHPLLSHGVYTGASGPRRRAMHRRLAEVADHPESRARHLALGTATPDESTLRALDAAAALAARRGAPRTAAELLELGLRLGNPQPGRRLRAAEEHFRSGGHDKAQQHLTTLLDELPSGAMRSSALLLRGAIHGYDNGTQALGTLQVAVAEADETPTVRAQALIALSVASAMTGDLQQSLSYASRAVTDTESLGVRGLHSQALSLRVLIRAVSGSGIDTESLATALALEDGSASTHPLMAASNIEAITDGWAGSIDTARRKMDGVLQRCRERGNPMDVVWATHFVCLFDLWSGRADAAAQAAEQAMEEAELVGGQVSRITALSCRAAVAAYRGSAPDTERAARAAIDAAHANGLQHLAIGPTASLAFVQTSKRDYGAALQTLRPLLNAFDPVYGTEIATGAYLPDAIESLVAMGQLDEAEPLVAALESNGARLQRVWMQAVGARGRAALLAARGDLKAAEERAHDAMEIHDALPMPFERARTRLLLAQLQRRRRRGQRAVETFAAAHDAFTQLASPVWADRARAEILHAANASPPQLSTALTSTERRVAERAAAGLSNRDIAAEMFISAKTVEMNLSRVYRKLGIRSRAQLHARLHGP